MTIPSTPRKAGPFAGTGANTAWPFAFKVFASSDILVTIADSDGLETALVLDTDYSVTLNPDQDTSPGGVVTYPISGDALATDETLVIVGNLPYDQPLDLPGGGNFSPRALENELDRLEMQIQQLREIAGRALQVSVTTGADVTLPVPDASKVIGWDQLGEGLANYDVADLLAVAAFANWVYDTYTADGITTSFTLQRSPGNIANMAVTVDGLAYVPSTDFTLSGTTLTFTVAPIAGAEILVRYGQAAQQVQTTYSTENQTATEGQTTFTLRGAVYTPGSNSLLVFVNGLHMTAGTDYTEVGVTQVTFTSGLSAGDEVVFICGQTLNNGQGASNINFLALGTGAQSRTVQSKLRDVVSVKDFGAVGNGIANDAGAIQLAINAVAAAGGGTVYLPAGNYLMNSGVTWTASGVHLKGAGVSATTLTCNFASGDIICIGDGAANPNDCSIEHLSISSVPVKTSGAAIRFRNGHNLRAGFFRVNSNMLVGVDLDAGPQQFLYYVHDFEILSGSNAGIRIGEAGSGIPQDVWIGQGIIASAGAGLLMLNASGIYLRTIDLLGCNTAFTTYPAAGQRVSAVFALELIADTCNSHGFNIITNGGSVNEMTFTACWASSCGVVDNGAGFKFSTGGGSVAGVSVTGGRVINNKGHGILLEGGTDFTFTGVQVMCNSTAGIGLYHGMAVAAGVGQWTVNGGVYGQGGLFPVNNQGYGILVVAGGSDNYAILGANVLGNVTGGIADAGTGTTKFIAHCPGYRTTGRGAATITSGNNSVTINHLLSTAPLTTDFLVVPVGSLSASGVTELWVSAASATTVTFRTDVNTTSDLALAYDVRLKGA
jgi:hypothetical protein